MKETPFTKAIFKVSDALMELDRVWDQEEFESFKVDYPFDRNLEEVVDAFAGLAGEIERRLRDKKKAANQAIIRRYLRR